MDINNKENDSLNSSSAMFGTPAGNSNATFSNNLKYTPIRPLVAAHRAAKNEHEVSRLNHLFFSVFVLNIFLTHSHTMTPFDASGKHAF